MSPEPSSPGGSSPANIKVELDLEDAPFLDEPEEAPPPVKKPAPETRVKQPPQEGKKASLAVKELLADLLARLFSNKKRLALIGGGLLLLLLTPVVLMLVFSGDKKPPAQEAPAPAPEVRVEQEAPQRQDAPPGPAYLYTAESFMVPLQGSEGELRFLRFRFSIPTDNPALYGELHAKTIALRDAVYYYLVNKPLTLLADREAQDVLKQDLISVVNEHVSADKIQDLYIEEYYITGR